MKRFAIVACCLAVLSNAFAPVRAATAMKPRNIAIGDLSPLRSDPDGGYTLNLIIDDGEGGTYQYVPVPALPVPPVPGYKQGGVFEHSWTTTADDQTASMTTIGLYYDLDHAITADKADRRLRVPVSLLENLDPSIQSQRVLNLAQDLGASALPFLENAAMPDLEDTHPGSFPPGGPSYATQPTEYVWTARKVTPAGTMWSGFYLAHTGFATADHAQQRTQIGPATRIDSTTQRVGGIYLQNDATRVSGPDNAHLQSTYTAGAATPAGDVPLTQVLMTEDRSGPHALDHAENHQDDIVLGVGGADAFIPLVGVRTHQTIRYGTDVTNNGQTVPAAETHRRTDLGVYVGSLSTFIPVVGYHYDGKRNPQDLWLSAHLTNGGPGDQVSGDWLASVGAYAAGMWEPVAGAAYDDNFVEHHYASRSRYSVGVFVAGDYHATVGATYDGDLPIVFWALDFALGSGLGDSPIYHPWEAAVGLFVRTPLDANDRFVPAAGLQFGGGIPYGKRAHQWHVYAGVYAASYSTFLPLLWAGYDGDHSVPVWALLVALKHVGGLSGNYEGSNEINAGASAGGLVFVPLVGAHYSPQSPSQRATSPYESYETIGVYEPQSTNQYSYVPLVGVTIATQQPMTWVVPAVLDLVLANSLRLGPVDEKIDIALLQPSYTSLACLHVQVNPNAVGLC